MKATVDNIKDFLRNFTCDSEFQVISESCSFVICEVPSTLTKYFVKCLKYYFKVFCNSDSTPVCTLVDTCTLKIQIV